ncbi:MAG: hypothetical protein SFU25_07540 [Candidatus Caenarcaniphilales bacterium]|nr:hypothetical protein [Candidatus Caenarcaniphilales bacterium]
MFYSIVSLDEGRKFMGSYAINAAKTLGTVAALSFVGPRVVAYEAVGLKPTGEGTSLISNSEARSPEFFAQRSLTPLQRLDQICTKRGTLKLENISSAGVNENSRPQLISSGTAFAERILNLQNGLCLRLDNRQLDKFISDKNLQGLIFPSSAGQVTENPLFLSVNQKNNRVEHGVYASLISVQLSNGTNVHYLSLSQLRTQKTGKD